MVPQDAARRGARSPSGSPTSSAPPATPPTCWSASRRACGCWGSRSRRCPPRRSRPRCSAIAGRHDDARGRGAGGARRTPPGAVPDRLRRARRRRPTSPRSAGACPGSPTRPWRPPSTWPWRRSAPQRVAGRGADPDGGRRDGPLRRLRAVLRQRRRRDVRARARRRAWRRRSRRRTPRPWSASCAGCCRCPATDPPLEVDADLRPEGKQGPMVRTLESYAAYYAKWSHVWEFQALLRADAVVGDEGVRARFTALIDPLRFPADGISNDDIVEVRRIKARVDDERLPRGADPHTHLKLGRGGLADVEWTVQLLQMRHAGRVEGLRTTADAGGPRGGGRGGPHRPRGRRDAGRGVAAGEPGAQRGHPGAGQGRPTSCRATPASGPPSPRCSATRRARPTSCSTTTCAPPGGRTRSSRRSSGSEGEGTCFTSGQMKC